LHKRDFWVAADKNFGDHYSHSQHERNIG